MFSEHPWGHEEGCPAQGCQGVKGKVSVVLFKQEMFKQFQTYILRYLETVSKSSSKSHSEVDLSQIPGSCRKIRKQFESGEREERRASFGFGQNKVWTQGDHSEKNDAIELNFSHSVLTREGCSKTKSLMARTPV